MRSLTHSIVLLFFSLTGSVSSNTAEVDSAFDDLNTEIKKKNSRSGIKPVSLPVMKTGYLLNKEEERKVHQQKLLESIVTFNMDQLRHKSRQLTDHEQSLLKYLSPTLSFATYSPELIKSCDFNPDDQSLTKAKKYFSLAQNLLFAPIIHQSKLETLAKNLLMSKNKQAFKNWTPLQESEGSIITKGSIYYKIVKEDSTYFVRFYHYQHDWDRPMTSSSLNPNLMMAQVGFELVKKKDLLPSKLITTTLLRGPYLLNLSKSKKAELISRTFSESAHLYEQISVSSVMKNEMDNPLVGAHVVDMALSSSQIYRYAASLSLDLQHAFYYLKRSQNMIILANTYLNSVETYLSEVTEAYLRLRSFFDDKSLSEEQFITDFQIITGVFPQFHTDEKKLLFFNNLPKKSLPHSKKSSQLEREDFPSLLAKDEIFQARTHSVPLENKNKKIGDALGMPLSLLPHLYLRHFQYYSHMGLKKKIEGEKRSLQKLIIETTSLKFGQMTSTSQNLTVKENPLQTRLQDTSSRHEAQQEIKMAFARELESLLNK